MRHGAIYYADKIREMVNSGKNIDCIFCSDMLNLAEFIGLCGNLLKDIPKIVYFHENQLTYPVRFESERDYQYVMTNFTTALAAEGVIFNSMFHKNEFLDGLVKFFKRMPDNQPIENVEEIRSKSQVVYPGIDIAGKGGEKNGSLKILWAARWEHDKNPEDFFAAIKILQETGLDFELNVIGEQFRDCPEIFDKAKNTFAGNINYWGYLDSKLEYQNCLKHCDIVVSTAIHEFYGIGMLEAISAGCVPVLPDRLSYPELLAENEQYLYDGTVDGLAERLIEMAKCPSRIRTDNTTHIAEQFSWQRQGEKLDNTVDKICG